MEETVEMLKTIATKILKEISKERAVLVNDRLLKIVIELRETITKQEEHLKK